MGFSMHELCQIMNNTWVKLYRKTNDNGLMKDHLSYILFSWFLINVDKDTGKMTVGRYRVCDELGINPSTYYKVLQRLEKKWGIITTQSTNKWTTVCIVKWSKYQHKENIQGKPSGIYVELPENESNTIQEYKNKEIQEYTPLIVPPKKFSSLEDITEEVMVGISEKYHVPLPFVKSKLEDLEIYIGKSGAKYKDYRLALMSFVKKDALEIIQKQKGDPTRRGVDARAIA